jgi:hypothetical protein
MTPGQTPQSTILIEHLRLQVAAATVATGGGNERDTVTVISRPLWHMFCAHVGLPLDSVPGPWKGVGHTIRVFGSETIVSDKVETLQGEPSALYSFSLPMRRAKA